MGPPVKPKRNHPNDYRALLKVLRRMDGLKVENHEFERHPKEPEEAWIHVESGEYHTTFHFDGKKKFRGMAAQGPDELWDSSSPRCPRGWGMPPRHPTTG